MQQTLRHVFLLQMLEDDKEYRYKEEQRKGANHHACYDADAQ